MHFAHSTRVSDSLIPVLEMLYFAAHLSLSITCGQSHGIIVIIIRRGHGASTSNCPTFFNVKLFHYAVLWCELTFPRVAFGLDNICINVFTSIPNASARPERLKFKECGLLTIYTQIRLCNLSRMIKPYQPVAPLVIEFISVDGYNHR